MKRNLQALALVAILYGTQAAAADAFPTGQDEWQSIPAKQTYSDRHAGDRVSSPSTSAFPLGSGEYEPVPAKETYVDRHRNDPVRASANAFPAYNVTTASE